jgi:hypothetical protein
MIGGRLLRFLDEPVNKEQEIVDCGLLWRYWCSITGLRFIIQQVVARQGWFQFLVLRGEQTVEQTATDANVPEDGLPARCAQ